MVGLCVKRALRVGFKLELRSLFEADIEVEARSLCIVNPKPLK